MITTSSPTPYRFVAGEPALPGLDREQLIANPSWNRKHQIGMAERTPQTRENHTRIDPLFHLFVLPVFVALLVTAVLALVRAPTWHSVLLVLGATGLLLLAFKARGYALKVQDRVIRLEERLRLAMLLPQELRGRVGELTEAQLIALRFASDGEVPELVVRALNENLTSKQIKASIRTWRPDYWRV